jgi:hypothetical protein
MTDTETIEEYDCEHKPQISASECSSLASVFAIPSTCTNKIKSKAGSVLTFGSPFRVASLSENRSQRGLGEYFRPVHVD